MVKIIRTTSLLAIALLFSVFTVEAQELNCQVTVLANKVQASNKRIFKTLETAIFEFMNNTKWTDDEYKLEERIDCSILITIDGFAQPGRMEAKIQVSASRPVFNSSYKSNLINYQDDQFGFNYTENAPIQFTPDQYRTNLASVLAFYAYYIIGLDNDSFSKLGGTKYLAEAQRVVSNAQNSPEKGWKSFDGTRNRYWMTDNILQKQFLPLRNAMYEYHREGMDKMAEDPVAARLAILSALDKLQNLHNINPLSFNSQMFFTAKIDELKGIFQGATAAEKDKFLNYIKKLDPSNVSKYEEVL